LFIDCPFFLIIMMLAASLFILRTLIEYT